jgi:hypothetical protein
MVAPSLLAFFLAQSRGLGRGPGVPNFVFLFYSCSKNRFLINKEFTLTFTSHQWLALIELSNKYDPIYQWFDYLKTKNHFVARYVVMSNKYEHNSAIFNISGKHAAYRVKNLEDLFREELNNTAESTVRVQFPENRT